MVKSRRTVGAVPIVLSFALCDKLNGVYIPCMNVDKCVDAWPIYVHIHDSNVVMDYNSILEEWRVLCDGIIMVSLKTSPATYPELRVEGQYGITEYLDLHQSVTSQSWSHSVGVGDGDSNSNSGVVSNITIDTEDMYRSIHSQPIDASLSSLSSSSSSSSSSLSTSPIMNTAVCDQQSPEIVSTVVELVDNSDSLELDSNVAEDTDKDKNDIN